MSRQAILKARLIGMVAVLAAVGLNGPVEATAGEADAGVDAAQAEPDDLCGFKAPPPVPGEARTPSTAAATHRFYYAGGLDQSVIGTEGATAEIPVNRAQGEPAPGHTLTELSITSTDNRQAVEVGWTIDRGLFPDWSPRLFVYHWVDGNQTCYNGCGFVAEPACPGVFEVGRLLLSPERPAGTTLAFTIWHVDNRWDIYVGACKVGYFPDSLWNGRFTRPSVIQVFGEVSARVTSWDPCGDMGTGAFPTQTTGAQLRLSPIPWTNGSIDLATNQPTPDLYQAVKTSRNTVRYGGPGRC
jgi:hypothetical protein